MSSDEQREFDAWRAEMTALAHRRLSPATLAALDDSDLGAVLQRKAWAALGEDNRHWKRRLRRMPAGQRMFWLLPIADEEIHNGGFHQFFWNQFGRFAPDALDGLRLIGAHKHADVLHDAMETFLDESDLQDRIRQDGSLEAFAAAYSETRLTALNPLWWDLSEHIDLDALSLQYARAHLEEFADG